MPSPTCPIPVSVVNSEWFERVPASEGGVAFLPTSIPAGESATLSGSIKVRIRSNDRPPVNGVRFTATDRLAVRAVMPWLNRILPSFEYTKDVEIAYPCSLGGFRHLGTLPRASSTNIHYEVCGKMRCNLLTCRANPGLDSLSTTATCH